MSRTAMADDRYKDSFPKGALIGAALLLGLTIALAVGMRVADIAPLAQITASKETSFVEQYLKFADADNGDVIVYAVDARGSEASKRRIAVLKPGTNGFIRAVMRGLVQARKIDGAGRAQPFVLTERADGRLVLSDPVTDRHIYLRAFGPTNATAFAHLLPGNAQRHRRQLAEAAHD